MIVWKPNKLHKDGYRYTLHELQALDGVPPSLGLVSSPAVAVMGKVKRDILNLDV